MPPSKPKPSEIAAEAKKQYIPYIKQHGDKWCPTSYLCYADTLANPAKPNPSSQVRIAFYDEDPVDFAIRWGHNATPIPVIMPGNDKRPGGDWEAGVMSPEECLCRRSNLYSTITTPAPDNSAPSNYPIPTKAGIYSKQVVVFRNGPERYETWQEYKTLPVISVCPVKRPKLDSSGDYSFPLERQLMYEKIKTILRIAIYFRHKSLCIGNFGLGQGFRNPPYHVAKMWEEAFFRDPEFEGHFEDIVFAFQDPEGPGASSSTSSSSKSKSSSSKSSSSKSTAAADLNIFRHVLKPANIHNAFQEP